MPVIPKNVELLAGSLWIGSIAVYRSATTFLGILGVSIGWALFQMVMILTGNVEGSDEPTAIS